MYLNTLSLESIRLQITRHSSLYDPQDYESKYSRFVNLEAVSKLLQQIANIRGFRQDGTDWSGCNPSQHADAFRSIWRWQLWMHYFLWSFSSSVVKSYLFFQEQSNNNKKNPRLLDHFTLAIIYINIYKAWT